MNEAATAGALSAGRQEEAPEWAPSGRALVHWGGLQKHAVLQPSAAKWRLHCSISRARSGSVRGPQLAQFSTPHMCVLHGRGLGLPPGRIGLRGPPTMSGALLGHRLSFSQAGRIVHCSGCPHVCVCARALVSSSREVLPDVVKTWEQRRKELKVGAPASPPLFQHHVCRSRVPASSECQ